MKRLIFPITALTLAATACNRSPRQSDSSADNTSAPKFLPLSATTSIQFLPNHILHVFSPTTAPGTSLGIILPQQSAPPVTTSHLDGRTQYTCDGLTVSTDPSGNLLLSDKNHTEILHEAARDTSPATLQNQPTHTIRQQWSLTPDESLYGLGQHQYDFLNLRGHDFTLWQHNTEIAIPYVLSSRNYAILWNNASPTKWGDPRDFEPIPTESLTTADGQHGFTATPFSDLNMTSPSPTRLDLAINITATPRANREQAVRWQSTLHVTDAGDYQFSLYANGGYTLTIDGQTLAHHWRQNWLPGTDLATVHFAANSSHSLQLDWIKDQGTTCQLTWKPPNPTDNMSLQSLAGDGVDYYVVAAGNAPGATDRLIAGYRQLTGHAPLMPAYAFGLWQSRQRYETQQASLDVVKGYRDRQIPFDNIVQDWMYWKQDDWGSHDFDPARFPDPAAWIDAIHDQHAHLMISVWPKFYPTTDNAKALAAQNDLYPVNPREKDWVGRGYAYTFYDAFNPDARKLFWQQIDDKLFSKHVDAWWMDATEPDLTQPSPPTLDRQMADMPGRAAVMNAYPMLNSEAVYDGQRAAEPADGNRVFILTRSGFTGMQRYAAASWSGDITSSWSAMKKQIIAGLDYSLSGMPYWTMDSGGFSVPARFSARNPTPEALDEWQELNARWFQFACFVPLTRLHGEAPFRELWQFGGENSPAYKSMLAADQLRYRLFPYIYSLAADVTQHDSTFMRPLFMDFPADPAARDITDQYLFGKSVLVAPVTDYKARSRPVYLPVTPGGWYNFWTGAHTAPGQITADASLDQLPLYIRAGTILPLAASQQYINEKPTDPLTLLIYPGADADFSLYEDDGATYAYEHNAYTRIPLHWNDSTHTLTIAKSLGQLVPHPRTLNITLIRPDRPIPYTPNHPIDKSIPYTGSPMAVKF